MGDDRPFQPPEQEGSPPQPDPSSSWSDPSAGWLPPGWQGDPSGYGPPGAPGGAGGGPGPRGGYGRPSPYGWSYEPQALPGRRGGRPLALVLGAVIVAVAIVVPVLIVSSSNGASQASSLYTKSMRLAGDSAGFHYVSTWTGGGEPAATYTGDAGQNDGTEVITAPTDFGNEQFEVLLAADQAIYLEGNAPALEDELGVPSSAAPGLAGQWVSLQPQDAPYAEQELGLTVASEVGIDGFVATSSEQVTGSGGATVTRVDGTVAASSDAPGATVQVDISPSTDLPATIVLDYSDGTVNTTTFTRWGTAPSVPVPASAVAWSTLTTSSPPDGYGSGETPTPGPTATATPTPASGAE